MERRSVPIQNVSNSISNEKKNFHTYETSRSTIVVIEHFPEKGASLKSILENSILRKIKG